MAFNLTTWSQKGRNFGRGSPPPRGSLEYVAVGDMWQTEPPRPATPKTAPKSVTNTVQQPISSSLEGPLLLILGGAACLGFSYLLRRRPKPTTTVAVPDALPDER